MRLQGAVAVMLITGLLTACQTENDRTPKLTDNSAAIRKLQAINKTAQTCWVKSKDKEFKNYKVIPELDTRVGKPRILIVSAKAAQGLPQYVIEAEGTPARVNTYGPLGNEPVGKRINSDIARWNRGEESCA